MKNLILMLLCGLYCCMSSQAQKLVTVYRGGIALTPTYTSMDSAVAVATDGDSIVLSPHVFNECRIIIRKELKITGTIGAGGARTVFDAKGISAQVFVIFNSTVPLAYKTIIFKDIDIRNANCLSGWALADTREYPKSGGGIFASAGTRVVLEGNTRIYGNKSSYSMWKYTGSSSELEGYGGAIYSEGDVTLRGTSEVFDNEAHFFGGIACEGKLIIEDSSYIHHNETKKPFAAVWARNAILRGSARISNNDSGGIMITDSLLLMDSATIDSNSLAGAVVRNSVFLWSPYRTFFECRDNARVHHNIGSGVICNTAYVHGNASIDSNTGTGLEIYSASSPHADPLSVITDSVRIWANGNGGINIHADSLELSGKATVLFNTAPFFAGINSSSCIMFIKDSAVIGFNTVDSSYGAAVGLMGSDLFMSGGQIIGNRSKIDSVKGKGMAVYVLNSDSLDIRNARIFNPNGDTMQQNEIYIVDSFASFSSDSTWWGDSDTSGIFQYADASTFKLHSWVVASWSLNGGLPFTGLSIIPMDAHFTLNTGTALPPNMFWMLAGIYQSDSGYFSPPLAFIGPANTISTSYHAPWTTRVNKLLGFVDADSFTIDAHVTGLDVPRYGLTGDVRVFPNPSGGTVHIQSSGHLSAIYIYDLNGRVVHRITGSSGAQEIVMLQKGTYIVEVFTNGGTRGKHVVIVQ